MKGLLLKEWYSGKGYLLMLGFSMLAFSAATIVSKNETFIMFLGYIGGMIPITFLSLDDQSKWTTYGNIFPYSRKDFVNIKYLITIIMMIITGVFLCISMAIMPMITGGFNKDSLYFGLSIVLAASVIFPAINLPLFFKYGSEKGRIVYYITIFVLSASIGAISSIISDTYVFPFDTFTVFMITIVISTLCFIISWGLSIKFYEARDL